MNPSKRQAAVKLKPCPFCGTPDPEHGGNFVQCRKCCGSSYAEHDDSKGTKAGQRWNVRATLPPTEQAETNTALEAAAAALDKAAAVIRARIQ